MRIILTFLLLLCVSFNLIAQDDDHIGCHHTNYKAKSIPGFTILSVDDTRSDSIDILSYSVNIDVTSAPKIKANTKVSASPLVDNIDEIVLDLLMLEIDSVFVDGLKVDFNYDGFQCYISLPIIKQIGEDFEVEVFYQGVPTRDPGNFGGLVTEQGYIYNLGIGISSNPHNFGRGWFPCFDNFMERSTFEYIITHQSNMTAHAVGTEIDIVNHLDGTVTTRYFMEQPITTYQSSIAIANYVSLWDEFEGEYGKVPIKLISKPEDSTAMKSSFGNLKAALSCIEDWYGPYVYERVGYVVTTVGAMEHPTNIAYPLSSINGNANSNTRLMSHELTHNWFGNLITLSTERDMWIKEGPAEYGWHLTAECIYGKDEFLDVVKDNHYYVLQRAHIDDEIFRALSGMPNEFTYGTHTYRKGASVIHNLRGYLGDEKFKIGMRSILENYAFSHLDADEFRDEISASTGIDMDGFFNAWIFNPGFAVFVDDSINSINQGNGLWETTIFMQQKLRATNEFHEDVPLTCRAIGFNGESQEFEIKAGGQFSSVSIISAFQVKRVIINENNTLNQSRMAESKTIESTGSLTFERTDVIFKVEDLSEAFDVRVENIWGKPDSGIIPGDFKIADQHYWRIIGDFPSNYDIGANFTYNGAKEYDLDYGVTSSEDSILLMYRKDASHLWEPLSDVVISKIIPNDGKGIIRLGRVMAGEYTVGKGVAEVVANKETEINKLKVYPNPATDQIFVYLDKMQSGVYTYNLHNLSGLKLESSIVVGEYASISVKDLAAGQYIAEFINNDSGKRYVERIVVIK